MRKFTKILIGIIIAYFLALLAFAYEENYRELIRNLFQQLTENKISFKIYRKYFHFASAEFISAFVIFIILIFLLLKRQENKQRKKNILFGTLLLIISTIIFCYVDSNEKLIECTACDDGKRVLRFNDINYDLIFISSLIFGILPTIITEIKNRNRKKILKKKNINKMEEQPILKISNRILEEIIERDFGINSKEVKSKLNQIKSDTESGKNRISAAILKLSNGNMNCIDNFIEQANNDFRDVISQAEYPRCSEFEFENLKKPEIGEIYLEDWKEYTEWLNKET